MVHDIIYGPKLLTWVTQTVQFIRIWHVNFISHSFPSYLLVTWIANWVHGIWNIATGKLWDINLHLL